MMTIAVPNSVTRNLSFDATLPRALVHRRAVHEVFVTDSFALSENRIRCGAQLPKMHGYFSDHTLDRPIYDIILLSEVFRQAQFVLCHRHLGIAYASKFIFVDGDVAIIDPSALDIGFEPGHAEIDVEVVDRRFRGDVLIGVVIDMSLSINAHPAATKRMTVRWMPPDAWDTLREKGRAALDFSASETHPTGCWIDPAMVGRHLRSNVVIAKIAAEPGGIGGVLAIDQDHPSLFDHPLDHVPGMLLFEAFRQVAIATARMHTNIPTSRLTMTRCACAFMRFGEFEFTTRFHVAAETVTIDTEARTVTLHVDILQRNAVIARADVVVGRLDLVPTGIGLAS